LEDVAFIGEFIGTKNVDIKLCKYFGARCGQPYAQVLFNDDELIYNISISHCKQVVGMGIIDNGLIGIDIEEQRDIDRSVVEKLFSEYDLKCIEKICRLYTDFNWYKAFTLVWTIKESCLKALGIGFRLGFKSIEVKDVDLIENKIFLIISNKVIETIERIPAKVFMYSSIESNLIITLTAFV